MARLCIQYEAEMEGGRKPTGLLDALEDSDRITGRDDRDRLRGEEKASRLSTLSLQHDESRMDDESRGGKRKIRLVQESNKAVPQSAQEETKAEKAKVFLAAVKRSLSQVNFQQIMHALQSYKRADDLDQLLLVLAELFTEDRNTHVLLREFYQFIRPHHKRRFDVTCRELTGIGCGYKPEHSLPKEEKEKLMQQRAKAEKPAPLAGLPEAHEQLNTSAFLNKGGSHLCVLSTQTVNGEQPSQKTAAQDHPMQKTQIHSTFLTDVKNAIGVEKSKQLFKAIQDYKKTHNYESMVAAVVSLLTEKTEDFCLLRTFAMFVRPQHKERFLGMLTDLAGGGTASPPSAQTAEDPHAHLETPGSNATPARGQSKISAFFSSSQRK
ncbi:hypothetical protein SKAU_G00096780 [Synaphobranchus kaupii]|uniref:Regulator of telomere elongation helicase 1 n=1 Tax=Synaphobranchus kaupii TaxID=118154 RepID=A0A9Q1FXS1_SYNKA|nr:hypothetical protein SKAU_G00096780 [Synaphobranchus kaupii]